MRVDRPTAGARPWEARDWAALLALLVVAVTLRVVFFTGFFGSDELTYTEAAYRILTGEWPSSNYIGSLRYGVNLPVAMFMKLFGVNEVAANLWSLLTSVGEVALVFMLGRMLWGARAGFLAGLTLAVLPLHVHFAGRMMADAPLAFFMTLSCMLFLVGEITRHRSWFLAAGLAAGAVFWIKQPVIVYLAIFGAYMLVRRRWDPGWLWMAAGALSMLGLNMVLMGAVTGDPWHVFKVGRTGVERFVDVGTQETSPWFYMRYLLLDVRHTWLLAFLGIGGAILLARKRVRSGTLTAGESLVLIWIGGLIGLFSLLVVSVNPVKLIFKQTNYILMFAAPLALLAGLVLSRLQGATFVVVMAVLVVGSVALSGLEQQAIQVFTANSKAAVRFAETMPMATIYATSNNVNAEIFSNLMKRKGAQTEQFKQLAELPGRAGESRSADKPAFLVVDLETIDWGNTGSPIKRLEDVPACWERKSQLQPLGLGLGRFVVQAMLGVADALPAALRVRAFAKLTALAGPRPAYVYDVAPTCSQ